MRLAHVIHVPVRTYNESNGAQGKWRGKHERRKAVKEAVTYALLGEQWGTERPSADRPWLVKLWRLAPREMDDDGVVSALKSARDAFAKFVDVDDKHRRIVRYVYDQERSKEYGVRIEVSYAGGDDGQA